MIHYSQDADTYFREISKTPLLTPEEEIELAARIKDGDMDARETMINANLRLVVKIANDYSNYGLPLLDLISEGNIGLMKAVERFNPAKGGKLSTYAAWWIKQSIKRALCNQSKTIRIPVHMIDKISKMRRAAVSMSVDLGREPTNDELAAEIGIDPAKVSHLLTADMRPVSLDAPVTDEGTKSFGEIIGDESAIDPLIKLGNDDMHKHLDTIFHSKVLDERERRIIDARFGFNGQTPKTLEEVGKEFGVTRERVRQLQNIALKKLRRALQKKEDPGPLPLGGARKKSPLAVLLNELDDHDNDARNGAEIPRSPHHDFLEARRLKFLSGNGSIAFGQDTSDIGESTHTIVKSTQEIPAYTTTAKLEKSPSGFLELILNSEFFKINNKRIELLDTHYDSILGVIKTWILNNSGEFLRSANITNAAIKVKYYRSIQIKLDNIKTKHPVNFAILLGSLFRSYYRKQNNEKLDFTAVELIEFAQEHVFK